MSKCLIIVVTIVLVAVLITSIVLMAKSFELVNYNKMALKKNVYSKSIEKSTVYMPGRYVTEPR